MGAALPSTPLLATYLVASVVLAITPGPGVFYIVTRSATQGRTAGLASVAGVALGNLGNATAASLGLATVFAMSSIAFIAVKYLGAAYLIFLGVRALRPGGSAPVAIGKVTRARAALGRIFADGFVVALFNPKMALFFAAFIPQFLPSSARPGEIIGMGGIFVLIAATTDTCYALTSGAVEPILSRCNIVKSVGRYVSGGALIGLGLLTAVTGHRPRS